MGPIGPLPAKFIQFQALATRAGDHVLYALEDSAGQIWVKIHNIEAPRATHWQRIIAETNEPPRR